MTTVHITTREGERRTLEGKDGASLMQTIKWGGIDELQAICGGCCSCATCHVYVAPEWWERLPPMSSDEDDLLDSSLHREATSRLSCQVKLAPELDGLAATIAPED